MNFKNPFWRFFIAASLLLLLSFNRNKQKADLILFNGKIITVDENFSIAEAVAVRKGKILAVGSNGYVLNLQSDSTQIIDLRGRSVIPGLIEAHAHPIQASQSELSGKIPNINSIDDLLKWISDETKIKKMGEWIIHPKFFSSRLKDLRQITIQELDSVAPVNPVFLNGSYGGMLNTKALELSGLTMLQHEGILREVKTGAPVGAIRSSVFGMLAFKKENAITEQQKLEALKSLFHIYNEMGITSVCSGGGPETELKLFEKLRDRQELSVRIFDNIVFPFNRNTPEQEMVEVLKQFNRKTGDGDEWVKIGALKLVIDGGVLTGTAYLHEGWGKKAREVYGIIDPNYRGVISFSKEDLVRIIGIANKTGWKFTAHATGGGAVDTLLAAFEESDHSTPVQGKRFSIIHGNFYTPAAINKMASLGLYADMQPAWYFKDAELLYTVLGKERMTSFHPYRDMLDAGIMINGGSDHMVKRDPNTSINPFNPFLAMWSLITRRTEHGTVFNAEQAISRKDALKLYTINNAYASFEERLKGSVEKGKLADMVVLSNDILTCPADSIREIKPLMTIVDGQIVFKKSNQMQENFQLNN